MAPPFAYRVTRVTLMGTSFGGAEEWSTGFYMGKENGDAKLPVQQLADDIAAAWRTFFIAGGVTVSSQFEFTLCKVSSFGTDGKSDANDTVYATPSAKTNGAGTGILPPQCALVATLTGPQARGLASKGRMYLPGITTPVGGNGKITSTAVSNIGTPLKAFLTAVNASTATDDVVINASHGQLTKGAGGQLIPKVGGYGPVNKAVTGLKIGDVYDTQRRRRNGLVETYQQFAGPF